MGHKGDGYYVSYMPYPVNNCDNTCLVVSQDDGEIYRAENDSVLSRTKNIFSVMEALCLFHCHNMFKMYQWLLRTNLFLSGVNQMEARSMR